MSTNYIQQILNRRLGIPEKKSVIPNKEPEPEPEPENIKIVEKIVEVEKPVPKNARGAGKKKGWRKMSDEEKKKEKEKTLEKLISRPEDIETIKEIATNSNAEEIEKEIKVTRKKLELLNSSIQFTDQNL